MQPTEELAALTKQAPKPPLAPPPASLLREQSATRTASGAATTAYSSAESMHHLLVHTSIDRSGAGASGGVPPQPASAGGSGSVPASGEGRVSRSLSHLLSPAALSLGRSVSRSASLDRAAPA